MAYTNSRHPNHDYRSKCIYLVTIGKAPEAPPFAECRWRGQPLVSEAYSKLHKSGQAIEKQLHRLQHVFPGVRTLQYKVMPDHLHVVLEYKEALPLHLGDVIANFKVSVGIALGQYGLFDSGYHDRILRRESQLSRMISYVKDNPRRWLVRKAVPQYFSRPHLLTLWESEYTLFGNFNLLRNPMMSPVKISRRYSRDQLATLQEEWSETARCNGVLVSPFISEAEKEEMRKGLDEGASIILITREEIGERYKPSGKFFDLCAQGRLLIFSTGMARSQPNLTRPEALQMNILAENMCTAELPLSFHLRSLH